jgi:hypothetical protein
MRSGRLVVGSFLATLALAEQGAYFWGPIFVELFWSPRNLITGETRRTLNPDVA